MQGSFWRWQCSVRCSFPSPTSWDLGPQYLSGDNSALTPSLPCYHLKTTQKVRNLKPLNLFVFFFALVCERISIKTHRTENRCYRTGNYTVCKRVPASSSLEVLQAGEVKGLNTSKERIKCNDTVSRFALAVRRNAA